MRFSRKKSVTITDNITIPSQVLTAKEYDQSIGSTNPANNASKSHFHDAAIAKSAHTAKLRMLSKRAKRKSKKSILKNGNSSTSSSATTTKQKKGVKNSNKPNASSSSKVSSTPTTNATAAAASTMSITVNGKPILNIEPNATPEDVQTFLSTLQCGIQSKSYELNQQKKSKKKIDGDGDEDNDDEEDIQDILPTSTSETEVSEEDVELEDILPTTTSETEASAESRDSDIKLGPRATQKFEQMEKDMDAEVSLYDYRLGKSLRTLLEMKSKMSACGPMSPEGEEETVKATDEKVEELVSQVAQVVENVQETITDASKEVQSLIFPEVSIQESKSTVGSSFEGTLSDKSWKDELNGYRLTGQTSDIRLNSTNDDISVDPSIETIEKEGDILIGFDQPVRTGVEENNKKKQRQKNLVDPYQMSLILDGVAVQSLTLGAAAMKIINDMISDAKDNVTTCDVLNGSAEQEQLEIDLKNSLSVEIEEVVQVQAPPPAAEEQDSPFIHPLILEKLNSFVEQAMVNMEQAKTATISTITSTSDGIQKAIYGNDGEDNRNDNDNLSFERSVSEDDRDYSIDAHINF